MTSITPSTLEFGTGALATVQVARQPILAADPGHELLGYELLFSDSGGLFSAFADVDEFRAASEVVSHSVLTLGVDSVVGESMAFMKFPRAQVVDATPLLLPPGRSVIELGRDTWSMRQLDQVVAHVEDYRDRGYRIALSDFAYTPGVDPLLALADYVKVDLTGKDLADARGALAPLRGRDTSVVAVGVDTELARELAVEAGAHYVQGFFFSAPNVVEGRQLPGYKLAYLQLLRKSYAPEVEFSELADIVKSDVALSYKLLKYVNSAHFGLRGRVESVQTALTMLGLDHVRRWVSVATVSGLVDPRPMELAVLCATRARFCEALGQRLRIATPHDCFSLGMFSLLDVMLGKSMEDVLADVAVSPAVESALHGRPGMLADLLEVVVAYERGRWDTVTRIRVDHGWPETDLIGLYIDAIEWSRDFFGAR